MRFAALSSLALALLVATPATAAEINPVEMGKPYFVGSWTGGDPGMEITCPGTELLVLATDDTFQVVNGGQLEVSGTWSLQRDGVHLDAKMVDDLPADSRLRMVIREADVVPGTDDDLLAVDLYFQDEQQPRPQLLLKCN